MIGMISGIVLWVIGGYIGGEFIIRWNRQHLFGPDRDPRKLALADRLNANLKLDQAMKVSWDRKILIWRTVLVAQGPVTIPKAILLRLRGGSA